MTFVSFVNAGFEVFIVRISLLMEPIRLSTKNIRFGLLADCVLDYNPSRKIPTEPKFNLVKTKFKYGKNISLNLTYPDFLTSRD